MTVLYLIKITAYIKYDVWISEIQECVHKYLELLRMPHICLAVTTVLPVIMLSIFVLR